MNVAGWCYLGITVLITFDIVARRLLGFSTEATTEVTGYLMAIGMSWGLAGTLFERGHVRIDVLVQKLPLNVRVWLHMASLLALLISTAFFVYGAYSLSRDSWELGATDLSTLRMPMVIPQGLWAAGLALLLLTVLAMVLRSLSQISTGQADAMDRMLMARTYEDEAAETLEAEVCISAVGITANTDGIGLEALGVNMDRGHITIDGHCQTNVKGLYAIGDCAGAPWLAHKASHEGIHAAEHISGFKSPNVHSPIAGCTYAQPQVASVGITEQGAREAGREVKIGRFPFKVNGKAIASGDTDGFVKTIFDARTGALIGAHMIGAEVTEMIQGYVTAITMEATEEDVQGTVYPHPTMSEAMHESALDAYQRVIHI